MIFTHTELIISGRPEKLWRAFVTAGGLCQKDAPELGGFLRSLPGLLPGSPDSRSVETHCPVSDSVLITDVGDRRASQGDDRNEEWRDVGGGEAGPAVMAASRAGISLPNLLRESTTDQ